MNELATLPITQLAQLLDIQSTLPVLNANFEEMNAALDAWLEKFDTVLTVESVKEGKGAATEINKLKAQIKENKKAAVDKISAPIKKFDDNMRALENKCETVRQRIMEQIKTFEDETREHCRLQLAAARSELWSQYNVKVEFCRATYDDMILISNVTDKGNLTKAALDRLAIRVMADRALQDRTERRLLDLENKCYRAGLAAPLSRQHVESFLFDADDSYAQRLQRLLDVEIDRQKEAERRILAQAEQKRKQESDALVAETERKARLAEQQNKPPDPLPPPVHKGPPPIAEPIPAHKGPSPAPVPLTVAPEGKTLFEVIAVFEVLVPSGITQEQVETKVKGMLDKAGFTTLTRLQVNKLERD